MLVGQQKLAMVTGQLYQIQLQNLQNSLTANQGQAVYTPLLHTREQVVGVIFQTQQRYLQVLKQHLIFK
jgi:hypothetical protein